MASRPRARLAVDEFDPFGGEPIEFGAQVRGAIRDMVETGTASLQKASDGRVGGQWLEQFEHAHERDPHALGGKGFGKGTASACQAFVQWDGFVE